MTESTQYGGSGSVLAVTAQNPGADGVYGTPDDVVDSLNANPAWIAYDATIGPGCSDFNDRVRGFYSQHSAGANFAYGDGSTRFVSDSIDLTIFRSLSTIDGGEVVSENY